MCAAWHKTIGWWRGDDGDMAHPSLSLAVKHVGWHPGGKNMNFLKSRLRKLGTSPVYQIGRRQVEEVEHIAKGK